MFPKILIPEAKAEVTILKVLEPTAGKRHYWCEAKVKTEAGIQIIKVRKPVAAIKHLLKVKN